MNSRAAQIASAVIHRSSRSHPADAVLREELRKERNLPPEITRETAQMVFAWFRWRGWWPGGGADEQAMVTALGLQERFEREPQSITDDELVAHAVPDWLREEMEITTAWLRALQTTPRLWLRAPPGLAGRVTARLGQSRVSARLPEAIEHLGREDLFRTEEFHAGEFEVQDIASQAVGLLCAPQPGETWWDACAGEGGKTLHLSHLMQNKGLIWASDRAEWRLRLLKRRTARARVFNYRAALWDGGPKLPTRTKFDGVLLDAPCSGVGTWQRNPHARWTTTPEDVRELAALQQRLLAHVAPAVKEGGRLIYAVCTLTRAETEAVADGFERDFPSFEPWPMNNPFADRAEQQGRVWLRPEATGGNGMFIAAWRRRAG